MKNEENRESRWKEWKAPCLQLKDSVSRASTYAPSSFVSPPRVRRPAMGVMATLLRVLSPERHSKCSPRLLLSTHGSTVCDPLLFVRRHMSAHPFPPRLLLAPLCKGDNDRLSNRLNSSAIVGSTKRAVCANPDGPMLFSCSVAAARSFLLFHSFRKMYTTNTISTSPNANAPKNLRTLRWLRVSESPLFSSRSL
jgi:hypothetical protein